MRKRFDDAITECGEVAGLDVANITAHKTRVQRWINDVRDQISELPYDFIALQSVTQIRTYTFVTAGTVSVSANGVEVTGVGTNFTTNITAPYQQWWFQISATGSGPLYRIANVVDSTTLELVTPWANTATGSVATLNYQIFRLYYPVPYAFRKILLSREGLGAGEVQYKDPVDFDYYGRVGSYPEIFTLRDTQDTPVETIYTGVTTTAGLNTVSANNTFLDDGLNPGDEFRILTTAFTIKRVLSQTSLDLTQAPVTTTGNTTATARTSNQFMIQFSPNIDQNNILTLVGYRKVFPLSNDADLLEEGWWQAIRAGVLVKAYEFLKRPIGEKESLFRGALQELIRNQKMAKDRTPRIKPIVQSRYSRYF